MGIIVSSLSWVMQDLYHQPSVPQWPPNDKGTLFPTNKGTQQKKRAKGYYWGTSSTKREVTV